MFVNNNLRIFSIITSPPQPPPSPKPKLSLKVGSCPFLFQTQMFLSKLKFHWQATSKPVGKLLIGVKEESGSADKVSQYLKYLFWQQKKEDDFAFEGIDERKHWLSFSLIEKERESIGGPLGLRKEGSHQRKSSGALSRGQFAQQKFCQFRKR